MTRSQVVKKIMKFLNSTDKLDFEQRLILLRAMRDVKNKINRDEENLDTILLKLRYGVKQNIPDEWRSTVSLPGEIGMVGELVEKPVPRGYVVRGGGYKRPGRTEKAIEKIEREDVKPIGRKLAIV
jgi:hypothetical protein